MGLSLSPAVPVAREGFHLTDPGGKLDLLKVRLEAFLAIYSPSFLSGTIYPLGHYIFDEAK